MRELSANRREKEREEYWRREYENNQKWIEEEEVKEEGKSMREEDDTSKNFSEEGKWYSRKNSYISSSMKFSHSFHSTLYLLV